MPEIDPNDTSLSGAQKNILESSTAQVALLNRNLTTIFLNQWNGWLVSMHARPDMAGPPPTPPIGYRLSEPDKDGFIWPEIGDQPVIPMPPLPAPPAPPARGHMSIGVRLSGDWFEVLNDDTEPFDTPLPGTSRDGVTGTFTKVRAVVGAGWYLKVG